MREIEFRGKVREGEQKGEWAYGGILHYGNGAGEHSYIIPGGMFGVFVEADNNTVGQYTGLKDKNGAKIFEGDIAAVLNAEWKQNRVVIQWDIESAGFYYGKFSMFHLDASNIEVVGNIHDSPELVEGK